MGEGVGNEPQLFPYISSANIACGYHAGDEETMRAVIRMAKSYRVSIGVHPSFEDRENFGRTMQSISTGAIYDLVTKQLVLFATIAQQENAVMTHVKPHGALYNLSAKNADVATAIAHAVKDFDEDLLLYGLSGSYSLSTATSLGLKTIAEVFADRTYQDDGSLTPRSLPGARLETRSAMAQQVLQMVLDKKLTSVTGKIIPIQADSVCVHSDGPNAVILAKHLFELLQQNNIAVKAKSNQ